MKPLINFSREPFRNRRLFWLLLFFVIGGASWVGLNTLGDKAQLEQRIAILEPKVTKLETLAKNGQSLDLTESTLSLAQNQALIVAQDLILRKGFSWSQLLNDLERFIPSTVRVTRIAVDRVGASTEAQGKAISLSFDVVGKSATEVTAMIGELNRSARFAVFPKSQKQVEGTDEVEFQLGVEYRPPQITGAQPVLTQTQVAAQATPGGRAK